MTDGPEAKAAEEIGKNAFLLLRKDGWIDYKKMNAESILRANAAHYLPLLRKACAYCESHDRGEVPMCMKKCEIHAEIARLEGGTS